jgi:hypothetical protein
MSRLVTMAALATLSLAALACDKGEPEAKQDLTQREKDSVFARSRVPGAKAVDKALRTADSATARQTQFDSVDRTP